MDKKNSKLISALNAKQEELNRVQDELSGIEREIEEYEIQRNQKDNQFCL